LNIWLFYDAASAVETMHVCVGDVAESNRLLFFRYCTDPRKYN